MMIWLFDYDFFTNSSALPKASTANDTVAQKMADVS
jgi:hypothetical protein